VVNLYIGQRRIGNVSVLDLKGRVRMIGTTVALHRSIGCLVLEGKTQILLNLNGVTHIDSSGLGELIASRITVTGKGGALKLCNLTDGLRDLMSMTKLLREFDVYDDESDAIASFTDEVPVAREPLAFVVQTK
jgi:anti-sigma B factor antagonist